MGTLSTLRNDYVCQFHALFIYLIPEDVFPEDSKSIDSFKPFLSGVILTREEEDDHEDDDDDGEELVWGRGKTRPFLFS